jgi:Core-2/I-Branching enzyme
MPPYLKVLPPTPIYPAPPIEDTTPVHAEDLAILYVMLVHEYPEFVERIIDSLNEPQHTFIIHVDLKSPEARTKLLRSAESRSNVFLVKPEYSQRVNWGGYSAVNATLQAMKYAVDLDRPFHYMQLLSGTSYPIKSNYEIRTELALRPGAIYMDVHDAPSLPHDTMWFHYVECDDRLHRINRLSLLRGTVVSLLKRV